MSRRRLAVGVAAALCAVVVAGCRRPPREEPVPLPRKEGAPAAKEEVLPPKGAVSLYFADADGAKLVAVRGKAAAGEAAPLDVLKQLIQGPPPGSGLMATIPSSTQARDVRVEGDLATVNLSSTFRDAFPEGSNIGYLCVYSIVHTLCDLPGIDRVRFVIEGKPVEALGQLDLRTPLTPDPELLAEGQ